MLRNSERFKNSRTLVITGERAQESTARANYASFEIDRADGRDTRFKRHIDHYRPIHQWSEFDVWDKLKDYQIEAHPAYRLGWSRLSCMSCIFGNKDQWASVRAIAKKKFGQIYQYEREFGKTIHRSRSVVSSALAGTPYSETRNIKLVNLAMAEEYTGEIESREWALPVGAFAESGGPS